MKFEISIIGDTSAPNDMRVLRELSALLNSTAASPASGAGTPMIAAPTPAVDDDDTPPATFIPGELDKNGLPWDERIHAKSRAKIADGSWRQKRGVDANMVPVVENELRQRMAAGSQAPTPAPVPMPQPVAAPVPMPVTPQPQPAVIPQPVVLPVTAAVPMPTPVAMPEPPPAATGPVVDFGFIMAAMQRGLTAQKIDGPYIAQMSAELGIADMTGLNGDNAKCWQAYEILVRDQRYVA